MILICFTACAPSQVVSPRQNFNSELKDMVGADIRKYEIYPFKLGYKGDLKSSRQLANGHLENLYQHRIPQGACDYVFEIDSNTHKVVSTRIEGDDRGCMIVP